MLTAAARTLPAVDSQFNFHYTVGDGVAHLSVEGELDIADESRFVASLHRCQVEAALVVVDLRELAFLSCGGLRALLSASRRARATGGRLVLVRGPATIQRLFDVVGVDLQLELVARPPERLPLPRSWLGAAA